ncbi:molecular chaperone HscA [Luteibacter sp. OK325]|uniref:hypothetical protein n=1 Tax=Luteibacter sp. OK325 TaxID=2135670 RepID=UPI000D42E713|nr:hypothetical protein [Luteibacter sp. OK325]PTR33646.1 molecular chaperone HscA [Luteibacter sp. OK325]
MDFATARVILSNFRDRIEVDSEGRFRLEGRITEKELAALDLLIRGVATSVDTSDALLPSVAERDASVRSDGIGVAPVLVADPARPETVVDVEVDLSTLALPEAKSEYRVCLDFGTAMSKATFVNDNEEANFEEIRVLRLGIPGNQEEIDEVMLVSSLFVDDSSRIWFGQNAVEQAESSPDGPRSRLDNIKRWLSEGNLGTPVDRDHNPTGCEITYEHLVLAYLTFFTWTVNRALLSDAADLTVPRNFNRRFAMPCFPRANAKVVEQKLKSLLGEAQVLADTFDQEVDKGLDLGRFIAAVNQLRATKRDYPFITASLTEPLGVAGSMLSWRSTYDALALVVDVGAGTSDFSLYRLSVVLDDEGDVDTARATAMEVDKSARGITEAGNHLDKILKGLVLRRSGVTSEHPKFINISYDLERNIRSYKESLFTTGSAYIVLYSGEAIEVTLEEFLDQGAVREFETSLQRTMVELLEAVNPEFMTWIRVNPRRNLTVVLTGGGAGLPMARKLARGSVMVNGSLIPVAAAQAFPAWLQQDYPDLEDHYGRIAVSLGGARKNVIQARGVATTTGSGLGGHRLESFPTRGV